MQDSVSNDQMAAFTHFASLLFPACIIISGFFSPTFFSFLFLPLFFPPFEFFHPFPSIFLIPLYYSFLFLSVADFGVSAQITATLAKRKSFIGTPYWLVVLVFLCLFFHQLPVYWSCMQIEQIYKHNQSVGGGCGNSINFLMSGSVK